MRGFRKSLFLAAVILVSGVSGSTAGPDLDVDMCGDWQRACAKLYGNGTKRWRDCMGQPQAIRDCQGNSDDVCGNWHAGCVRLYGWQTQEYRNCMKQPQALRDCGLVPE
jgi:hypothetical protein